MNIETTKKIKILHVDDDNLALELTKMYLERMSSDLELVPLTSSTQALDVFKQQSFDCVISDFHMPVLDGLAFMRRVREIRPDVPFMLLSGDDREDVAVTAMISGADEYIVKGNHTDHYAEILKKIKRLLNSQNGNGNGNGTGSGYEKESVYDRILMLLEDFSSPAYIVSEDNKIVFNNEKFIKKYGNSVRKKCHDVLFSSDFQCVNCINRDERYKSVPFAVDQAGGTDKFMRMFYHPIRNESGEMHVLHMILNTLN